MRKLRVGVWINEDYNPEMGGGFGYYSQIIEKLYQYNLENADVIFISRKFSNNWNKNDKSYQIQTTEFERPILSLKYRIINKIAKKVRLQTKELDYSNEIKQNSNKLKEELSKVIDVIYYPIPGCAIENFPYIYTLWDIGHLSMYAFPEVTMNGCYESRNQHHGIFPQKALMVFCESESGKKEAEKYLSLNQNKIKVVPIFPSTIIDAAIKEEKPNRVTENSFFIHYPAQFWSHKNHYNLIIAFKVLLLKYPDLKLILSGSDKGNKQYILELIDELALKDTILDLGFVKIEELKWIYKHSQGLVMPTFLGPTNMPLLEAAELGCSVCCSNLEGHKEQLGNYAYYFNPLDSTEIANTVIEMIESKKRGEHRAYESKFNISNALHLMDSAFSEIKNIRFCWGTNDQIF